jgi:UDP-N-acetylmuramoylalanine-D-glutamate ligase
VNSLTIDIDLNHLETVARKNGILYVHKGYFKSRDLLLTLLDDLERNFVLISIGRSERKIDDISHPSIRNIINVIKREKSNFNRDSEESFRHETSSIEKAILLSEELAKRGDVVFFSPYGTEEQVGAWFNLFKKHVKNRLL